MARKYVRDNRGRFASGGSGATARGGRLRTASGNKRATQTMKAAGTGGVIKGRSARTVAGEKVMAKLAKRAPAAKRISAARPGGTVAKPKGLKPEPGVGETLKWRQKRAARIAENMQQPYTPLPQASQSKPKAKQGRAKKPKDTNHDIFGYKWSQIQAAQRGDRRALRTPPSQWRG